MTWSAGAGSFVGIDVVDLSDPRCLGKHEDQRFLTRVLADSERAALSATDAPRLELWRLWAAKEAAFKVASKVRGSPPPFVHAAFVVEPHDPSEGAFGTVSWEDLEVCIHWHEHADGIAALGWNGAAADEPVEWSWAAAADLDPDPGAALSGLLERLTEPERAAVHSRSSALVRLAAKAALGAALGVDEARIQIVCEKGPTGRMPPHVLLDGDAAPVDVSLSHHGRWLAWGIRLADPRQPPESG